MGRSTRSIAARPAAVLLVAMLSEAAADLPKYQVVDIGQTVDVPLYINDAGEVAGTSSQSAFLYSDGILHELGTLGGSCGSSASAINNFGQVTGLACTNAGELHAFLYADGSMSDLGTLGGPVSQPWAINDHGQVVGASNLSDLTAHAFLYADGIMTDLGALGLAYSTAQDINNAGQITGGAGTTPFYSSVFLLDGGAMFDLGSLGGGLRAWWGDK